MENEKPTHTNNSSGIGFFGLLTVLFIALKLSKQVEWSWWWVLAPMWLPLFISLIICLVVLVALGGV